MKVLKTALPEFDTSSLSEGIHPPLTSVIFADVVELSEDQLSILGFVH